jgi:large subunit ribosomal protein L21
MANLISRKAKIGVTKPANVASGAAFSVIKTGGKQYRVAVGDVVKIEIIKGEFNVGDKVDFKEVVLVDTGSETKVGTPTVAGAVVKAEIVEIDRDAKVIVARYKQKSRSGFKKNGHRQPYFKVKILSI